MKPASQAKWALVIAFTVVVACILALHQFVLEPRAKATQELSKMMEMRIALANELEDYYKKHGEYPRNLKDLPLEDFPWGAEGSTPKDLDSFSYISDGQIFVMRWKGEYRYSVYLAGKKGESIFSESETNNVSIGLTNGH